MGVVEYTERWAIFYVREVSEEKAISGLFI